MGEAEKSRKETGQKDGNNERGLENVHQWEGAAYGRKGRWRGKVNNDVGGQETPYMRKDTISQERPCS